MLLSHEPSPEFLPYKTLHMQRNVFSLKNLIPIRHSVYLQQETHVQHFKIL